MTFAVAVGAAALMLIVLLATLERLISGRWRFVILVPIGMALAGAAAAILATSLDASRTGTTIGAAVLILTTVGYSVLRMVQTYGES